MPDPTPPAGTPTPRTTRGSKRWQPPAPEELQALLPADYTVEKLLGRGGMGAVYQGRRISLDRAVAIKILSTDLEDTDTRYVERFKNEARAMAQLSHPGIVAVYGFGETADGLLYIVMEFIAGTDVHRMIKEQGRLRTEHAMAITAHVCDALAFAHERGIIHRDIKPANIMVGYDGVVKVADFGLAKMTVDGATLGLTKSGMAMGTLHYIAPEALILGTAVDHRADIYAVGVMLYQMLTGKLPQGVVDLPSEQVPGLDPRYDAIIAKAMTEDRDHRYQNIRELRSDLDNTLTQPVVKVEAEAAQVPAALTTTARPQRPAGHASPSPLAKMNVLFAGLPFPWRVGLMLGSIILVLWGAGYLWFRPQPTTALAKLDELVEKTSSENAPTAAVGTTPATPSKPPESPEIQATKETAAKSFAEATLAPQPLAIQATKEQPFVNSLSMKFVSVPGTNILMCIHETRKQDYAAYAAENTTVDDSWKNAKFSGGLPVSTADNHPVVHMSWNDAKAFCEWLSRKEGKTYRLPTDEEWSIAVGLGQKEKRDKNTTPQMLNGKETTEFPWGGGYPPKTESQAGNYSDMTWHEKFPASVFITGYNDGFVTTAPVMSFKPNSLGIYDLGGNVLEWCEDWQDNAQKQRVLRSSACNAFSRVELLSSIRHPGIPTGRYILYGFRCVLEDHSQAASVVPSPPRPVTPTVTTSTIITAGTPFTNSLNMKFVPVPGTGNLICIHETRKQDYAAYAAENPTADSSWQNPKTASGVAVSTADNHPVVNVNWNDAKAFCTWLSKKEGKNYRLPTDHEWSFAVGIGADELPGGTPSDLNQKIKNVYPWGTVWPPPNKVGNYADIYALAKFPTHGVIDGYTDGYGTTAPVMSFPANVVGIYDLGGNVLEWCEDWYNTKQDTRVMRGGAWLGYGNNFLLSSCRYPFAPDKRYTEFGFRCLLATAPATKAGASTSTVTPPMPPQTALASTSTTATTNAPFMNSHGMKFVPVPGTEVLFCIHETRYKDYAAYAAATSGVDQRWKGNGITDANVGDHPVAYVTWNNAKAFCAWLGKQEGRTYRLATDQEWQRAVGVDSKAGADNGRSGFSVSMPPPGR